jgi:hypothetical protein
MSTACTELIIAEIHRAITALGGTAEPTTATEARRAVRALGADVDLRSILDSWQDTLDDDQILEMLRAWNAGRPVLVQTYAEEEALLRYPRTGGSA